jgi:hypothetical protein
LARQRLAGRAGERDEQGGILPGHRSGDAVGALPARQRFPRGAGFGHVQHQQLQLAGAAVADHIQLVGQDRQVCRGQAHRQRQQRFGGERGAGQSERGDAVRALPRAVEQQQGFLAAHRAAHDLAIGLPGCAHPGLAGFIEQPAVLGGQRHQAGVDRHHARDRFGSRQGGQRAGAHGGQVVGPRACLRQQDQGKQQAAPALLSQSFEHKGPCVKG